MKLIIKLWKKRRIIYSFDKRERFALQTGLLAAGMLVTQLIWEDYRFLMVFILSFSSYLLTLWSLKEDVKGVEWLLLFIMPIFFTAFSSLFYFLLPARWVTRIFVGSMFAVGMYAILLVENIYNVAVERSIQLLRAAQSVGLLMTLVIVFLFTNIIFSLRLPFYLNYILTIPVVFLLSLQSLWSVKLEPYIDRQLIIYSFVISLGIGEMAAVLSFWPMQLTHISLLISASFYCLIGVVQHYLLERLFKENIKEFIIVFIFTFLVIFLATRWTD